MPCGIHPVQVANGPTELRSRTKDRNAENTRALAVAVAKQPGRPLDPSQGVRAAVLSNDLGNTSPKALPHLPGVASACRPCRPTLGWLSLAGWDGSTDPGDRIS